MTRPRQPLTPALLAQFQKLGVTTASGEPLPAAPAQLSTHELKARGWTPAMIAKLLPRPDATRANQLEVGRTRKRLTAPVKLYALARVEEAETTEEFLLAQAAATKAQRAAGKGLATRADKLRAYVEGYVPQLVEPAYRLGGPIDGLDLWHYHLRELTAYERDHDDAFRQLSRTAQRQGSNEIYTIHRNAFRAKFGEKY